METRQEKEVFKVDLADKNMRYHIVMYIARRNDGSLDIPACNITPYLDSYTTISPRDDSLRDGQYEQIQVGDIYDSYERKIVPMTEEILNLMITSERSAYIYQFLKKEYREDPEILCRFLNSYKSILPNGRYSSIDNPISYALPNALTDENIKLAIFKGGRICFSRNACWPLSLYDEESKVRQKTILGYLYKNGYLTEKEYENGILYTPGFSAIDLALFCQKMEKKKQ